ncbi:MAG: DUF1015 domain-containing protein [Lachnospiraceae bacterium]|nr:DUF1015 domain-containing protein [Lachnospiraceae bacterium]
MATVRPFKALHPAKDMFEKVAALPYDVYNAAEAREVVEKNPQSFLAIDRPETQFEPGHDMYAPEVYKKASEMLKEWEDKGIFVQDDKACYYIYTLTMDGREQNGIVGCSSVDDYLSGTVRQHEHTLARKEQDRIDHVDACSAQTGPIFLAYRSRPDLKAVIAKVKKEEPMFDLVSEDGIRHAGWRVDRDEDILAISKAFEDTERTYIADGHHRCASAVKVALKRRQEAGEYTGEEEYNYFLSVLFADEELYIMPYNRLVRDLNGMSASELLSKMEESFIIKESGEKVVPASKGTFGMYLDDKWYELKVKPEKAGTDEVSSLDVSYLQTYFLDGILGISDPKKDPRVDFAGGIRGIDYLVERCHEDAKLAVVMYPTSIYELLAVADAQKMMPPKSTWFEPKLRSGIFIHKF